MRIPSLLTVFTVCLGGSSFAPFDVCGADESDADNAPEIWLHHRNWPELIGPDAQWDFVKKNVDGFQFFDGNLDEQGVRNKIKSIRDKDPAWAANYTSELFESFSKENLKEFVKITKENDIDLSIETGGLHALKPLDDTIGERTAKAFLKRASVLTGVGAEIRYLNFDGPIRRVMNDPLRKDPPRPVIESLDDAVDQVIAAMRTIRETWPNVQFFMLTNFPNWGYKGGPAYTFLHERPEGWGDYSEVIQTTIRKTREAGIPIAGVTCDFPYDYIIAEKKPHHKSAPDPKATDWVARVRELEDDVEAAGVEFNLIYNSQRGGGASAEDFYRETLEYIELYRKAGGSPKRYIIESWYRCPEAIQPESTPFTMTNLVAEIIRRVKGIEK